MLRTALRLTLVAPLALVAVAACARGDEREAAKRRDASAAPVRSVRAAPSGAALQVDAFGDTVPATLAARRIVSLTPATTELLFALGAGPRLVGRTHWDSYPDSARLVSDLGDGLRPNVEAVLAARPDLVVLYGSADNRAAAATLRKAGVATVALKSDHVADLRRDALLLGRLTGSEARGRAIADSVDATLARVRAAVASLDRPTVFWHVWDAPLITIGRGSYLNELVETAGGRNVFGDLSDVSPQVSFEELLRRDPDVILAGADGAARLRASPQWRRTRAVREGRLLVVDTALVGRPGVRMGEAAVQIANLLHPGAVK